MGRLTYAEIINLAKVMLSGLKSNIERLGKRGINNDFITSFENNYNSAMNLDNEQEDLKAKLKSKTSELDGKIEELEKLISEAKKVIKLEMEQASWKTFGIQDSK